MSLADLHEFEPGRLIRLQPSERILYIDPEREAEAAKVAAELSLIPMRLLSEIPEGWTESDERQYQDYLLNVKAVLGR